VQFLRNSYFKKISTSILLVLFIFIHAVKAFHTHDLSAVQSFNKNTTSVKAGFFCAICDFQIAKDSDAAIAAIHIAAPAQFIVSFCNYTLPELSNFPVTSSVRGPPAVA